MELPVKAGIRLSEESLRRLLDRLDAEPEFQEAMRNRKHTRYQYRAAAVSVELRENDETTRTTVPSRNLSAGGICLLLPRLAYAGTEVRIRLVSEHNTAHVVVGRVVRCRYLSGTAGIHEVGVAFSKPIDIAMFVREANAASVLVVDDDEMHRKLFGEVFRRYSAEVTFERPEDTAKRSLIHEPFDLIVFGFHTSRTGGCELARKLRSTGYVRPILGLAMMGQDELKAYCEGNQCEACVSAPINAQSLTQLVKTIESEPIVSFRAQDPNCGGLIATFVQSASERIAAIEQAYAAGEAEKLRDRVQQLVVFADSAGFEPVAQAGRQALEHISANDLSTRAVRDRLATLLQRCRAARASEATRV